MTSIPFVIVRIYSNEFKYIYLRNKTFFEFFCMIFEIYFNFWIFWKNGVTDSLCISEITGCERRA